MKIIKLELQKLFGQLSDEVRGYEEKNNRVLVSQIVAFAICAEHAADGWGDPAQIRSEVQFEAFLAIKEEGLLKALKSVNKMIYMKSLEGGLGKELEQELGLSRSRKYQALKKSSLKRAERENSDTDLYLFCQNASRFPETSADLKELSKERFGARQFDMVQLSSNSASLALRDLHENWSSLIGGAFQTEDATFRLDMLVVEVSIHILGLDGDVQIETLAALVEAKNMDSIGCATHCKNISPLTNRVIEKLMVCGRCKAVYYCSQACQKKAWPSHKLVCTPKKKPSN